VTQDAADAIEPFQRYLHLLAELHLDRRLRGKQAPSDVVQQTMLRAYATLAELRDTRPEVLVAWLRQILAWTLADAVKHYGRDERDVELERSLEADLDRSALGFAAWLAADRPVFQPAVKPGESHRREVRRGALEAVPGRHPGLRFHRDVAAGRRKAAPGSPRLEATAPAGGRDTLRIPERWIASVKSTWDASLVRGIRMSAVDRSGDSA
jgi:DNA-directed RNA polymerase specialized sigma24 family protein